ncbi:MAG TPA: helix-turn-helix domain-containing protein [Frankiaceae bacterium]|nr:helix-turn-helix domain-containing protein [Frankiaceae bacterium]
MADRNVPVGALTSVPTGVDRLRKPAGQLGSVAAAAAADAGGLDPTLLADYLEVISDVAGTGRRLSRPELNRFRFQGRRAALEGVPLRALVELYLKAAWRLWRHLPAVRSATHQPDELVDAGEAVLRAVDEAVAAGVEGHQLARREMTRREEAARRELFDDLISGRPDANGVVMRAADFGLDLAGPHAVAIIGASQPFVDGTPLVTRLESAVLGAKGDANALLASKDGALVVIFAAPDDAAIDFVVGRLAHELGSPSESGPHPTRGGAGPPVQLRRPSGVGRWQITLGRARPGAAGVFASYEEALDARELAARLRLDQPVVAVNDLLVYRMLLRDRTAIADLVNATLRPLTQARGGAGPLLETLSAYYETGGNTTETARRLHLSVRAVTYRLERVTALTGRDPANPADRFTLNTAVLGAKLLDWPRQPLES